MDSKSLAIAYADFYEMAASGPFSAPATPQKWTAEQIVAHIIVIDHLLAATISELRAGRTPNHDNRPAIRDAYLQTIAKTAGDLPTLIALARHGSAVVCDLVRQVDAETAAQPFPILLQSGERIVVDTMMPLTQLVEAQAKLHLPGHLRQLQGLKA